MQLIILHREKLINVLEWFLIIGFCIISSLFSSGVVDQFLSGKTSFAQYEEPMTNHPAIVIRFSLKPSELNFSDVNISYTATGLGTEKNLSLGNNYFLHPGDNKTRVIYLDSFVTVQDGNKHYKKLRGFRIINLSPLTFDKKGTGGALIKIYHHLRESKPWENDQIKLTITSVMNSPGVRRVWKDGTPLHFIVRKNTNTRIEMKAERYKFLEQKGECQQESFYECIVSKLELSDDFKACPTKCIPKIFSNLGLNFSSPFCPYFRSGGCVMKIVRDLIWSSNQPSACKKSCSILQYFGQISENHPDPPNASDKSNYYRLRYKFADQNMYVSEEYFIHDIMNVIGSVGGTLGMFIGFSMTGFMSWIFSKLRTV